MTDYKLTIDGTDYLVENAEAVAAIIKALPHLTRLRWNYDGGVSSYSKVGIAKFNLSPVDGKVFDSPEDYNDYLAAQTPTPGPEDAVGEPEAEEELPF